jgi:hypothetical protein
LLIFQRDFLPKLTKYDLLLKKDKIKLTQFCLETEKPAVSHIPHFGDAVSPAGDVDVSAGDVHL